MTRNRLVLPPSRVITDGLVAWHDLYFPVVNPWSNAAVSGTGSLVDSNVVAHPVTGLVDGNFIYEDDSAGGWQSMTAGLFCVLGY